MYIQRLRRVVDEKLNSIQITPEHDYKGHHYRFHPTNQVYDSVTTKTGVLDNPRLKRWAANLAVEYIDRNKDSINEKNKRQHYKAAVLAHEDVLKDAGNVGTEGHDVIERYLKIWIKDNKQPDDIRKFIKGEDARLWAITRSAEQFCNDFELIPIASEIFVASPTYEYAGTLDCLAVLLKEEKPPQIECLKHEWQEKSKKKWICKNCKREVNPVLSIVDWKTSNSVDKPEYAMQVAAYSQALKELTGIKPEQLVIVQLSKDYAKYNVVHIPDEKGAFTAFKNLCKVYDWKNDGVTKIAPYNPKKESWI